MLRPSRTEVAITAAAIGWATVLLAPDWVPLAVTVAVFGLTLPFCVRQPPVAVGGLVVVELAHWALGVPQESPASLIAFASVFCLGRWAAPRWLAFPMLAMPTIAFLRDDLGLPSLVFVAVVVGTGWSAGRLVRLRDERALAARREAAAIAQTDPRARAERMVAEERARLAGEALAVVRTAVDGMLADAAEADRTLDPADCAAAQAAGRRAVSELRRLLGLLRSQDDPPPVIGSLPRRRRRRVWPVDLALATAAVGLVLTEAATVAAGRPWPQVALTALSCLGLAMLRTDAALACLVSAVPVAGALAVGQPLFHGMEVVLVTALLAWSAGADGRPRAVWALAGWGVLTLVDVRLAEPGNEPMLLALVLLGLVAGHLWHARRLDESSSRAAAERLRAVHDGIAERAVRAERLRVARDLHDVASSAIGVMVLQAGAAEVHCRRGDVAAARAALDAVRTAGSQAQAELAVLFGLLDAGAVGAAGLAGPVPVEDLLASLAILVDRMRAGGMDIDLDVGPGLDRPGAPAGTAYRVVQESLTNAAKHARGSRVRVRLSRNGHDLCIEVADDGPPSEPSDGGFGLVGLFERVRAEGGQVTAGPCPDGGFAVTARLPVTASRRTGAAP